MTGKKRTKKELIALGSEIVSRLEALYPSAICSLAYEGEPWKLLVMGRLSAQCTDARVNEVCRGLFAEFPTAEALAKAPIEAIEAHVRPCGLYKVKAQNIKDECILLTEQFGGVLPSTMEELLAFPGVGRKIANLILGDIYHLPAIVADTHCIRLCGRFGFYPETLKDPAKVEKILSELIAPEAQSDFCHRLVLFGREYCTARSPKCESCPLNDVCNHARSS